MPKKEISEENLRKIEDEIKLTKLKLEQLNPQLTPKKTNKKLYALLEDAAKKGNISAIQIIANHAMLQNTPLKQTKIEAALEQTKTTLIRALTEHVNHPENKIYEEQYHYLAAEHSYQNNNNDFLLLAVKNSNTAVRALLENGASAKDLALAWTKQQENESSEIIALLKQYGASDEKAFLLAAKNGYAKATQSFIDNRISAKAQRRVLLSVLSEKFGSIDVIKTLVKKIKPSHLNAALLVATKQGHLDIISLLLEKGASISTSDLLKKLPIPVNLAQVVDILKHKTESLNEALIFAAKNGALELTEQLLLKMDTIPLHASLTALKNKHTAIAETLLSKVSDTDKESPQYKEALAAILEKKNIMSSDLSKIDTIKPTYKAGYQEYLNNMTNTSSENEIDHSPSNQTEKLEAEIKEAIETGDIKK